MQGEWFDAASALIAFTKCSTASPQDVVLFHHTLIRLVSLLNACVLMELSSGFDENSGATMLQTKRAFELELIDAEGLDSQSLLSINSTPDKVQLLFTWIQQLVVENSCKNVFSVAAPILSRCFQELGNGMVSYRQASKIARIPLPFPYVQATEMLLVSHWLLIPFLMCVWVSSPLWTGLLTFVQVAFFWSLNSIATELENPFGEDTNDLPAQEMQKEFNDELLLLLRPSTGVTAHLSQKAVLTEMDDLTDLKKLPSSMGKTISLSRKGVNAEMPRHKRRSSLEGKNISLAAFQERINDLEIGDYTSENGSDGGVHERRRISHESVRLSTKERALAPVAETSSLHASDVVAQKSVKNDSDLEDAVSSQMTEWQREISASSGGCSASSSCDGHPGGNEVLVTKRRVSKTMVCFDKDVGHLGLPNGRPKSLDSSGLAEEKCVDPMHAPATRQLVADLACLPELVTVCEELRDRLQVLQPEMMNEQLLCLQELVQLARDGHERAYAQRPMVGAAPDFGAFSAQRCNLEADILGRTAMTRVGAGKPVSSGCGTLRSCGAQQSAWSSSLR